MDRFLRTRKFIPALLIIVLLISPMALVGVVRAQTSGTCFPAGNVIVNTAVVWTEITCLHSGNVQITGTGLLQLVRSTLVQDGGGNFSQMLVNQQGSLILQTSTLTFTNRGGSLLLVDNGSASFETTSNVFGASISMNNMATLSATGSSVVNSANFSSAALATVSFDTSSLVQGGGEVSIQGTSLQFANSNVVVANSSLVALSGLTTSIQSSSVEFDNVSNAIVGGKPFTNSNTTISSSSVTALSPGVAGTLIVGNGTLSVTNSNVSSRVSSSAFSPVSALTLAGGSITVSQSSVTSTAREFFGYIPRSVSSLKVAATSLLSITSSELISGKSNLLGTYRAVRLGVSSGGNSTISDSLVQAAGLNAVLSLSAGSNGLVRYMTVERSRILTLESPGNVTFSSSYGMTIDRSTLDANLSSLVALSYSLKTVNSFLRVANITNGLSFGGPTRSSPTTVSVGTFYNTTLANCFATPCIVARGTGSYSIFGWIFGKVVDAGNSQPVPGATITVTDTRTGLTQTPALTNQSGWAEFAVLLRQNNGTKSLVKPSYAVQGSLGSSVSPQSLVLQSNVAYVTLKIATTTNVSASDVLGQSSSALATNNNMANFTYFITPAGQYQLGNYIGAQYTPIVTLVTNAAPLNFRNNATNSEIDFNTVGAAGKSLTFVLIYPRNLTLLPFTILVDGLPLTTGSRASNSTFNSAVFTLPSGAHTIGLSYLPPNGQYTGTVQYPRFFPPFTTVVLLVTLATIGIAFLIFYLWRSDRSYDSGAKGPAKSP